MEVKDGTIKTGSSYSSSEQAISLAFFPKRTMDYNTCELARAAKLTKDKCYYLSFKYPRRNEGFSEEFYPECTISEPSMSLDEWKSGENKPLARKKITEIENKFKSEPMIFDKKVEKSNVTSGDNLAAENELLKKEVEELKEKLNSLHRHNDELVARNEDLTREIESIRNTNAN